MNTTDGTTGDIYNAAIAAQLRSRKAEIGSSMTYEAIEAASGIKTRQLKYLFNDQRAISLSAYLGITAALGLDPAVPMRAAQALAQKSEGKSTR